MPNVRMLMFFNAKNYAWAEGLWLQRPQTVLSDGAADAAAIATARSKLLGLGASITEVRLSFQDPSRLSYVVLRSDYAATYAPPSDQYPGGPEADESFSSIILRLQDTTSHRKIVFLSGYPDFLVTTRTGQPSDIQTTPDWQTNFLRYLTALRARGAWRALVPAVIGGNLLPITRLDTVGGIALAPVVATTADPVPGAVVGGTIQLTGFRHVYGAVKQLNGRWTISNITTLGGTNYTLVGSEGIRPADYLKFGFARVQVYQLFSVDSGVLVGATHHKRGVRTGQPLGRSRKAK